VAMVLSKRTFPTSIFFLARLIKLYGIPFFCATSKVNVQEIRAVKKEKKINALQLEPEKPKVTLKIGDRVRMIDGKAIGTIDKIEKNKAVVNYGMFTSKVTLELLEYVQAK